MRGIFFGASLLLANMVLGEEAQASGAFEQAFGPCSSLHCVIRSSDGGNVRLFRAAADEVLRAPKKLIIIDGPCYSACVQFADRARQRVCITERATFGFHKAVVLRTDSSGVWRPTGHREPEHSRDIAGWVKAKGGFPTSGMRMMSGRDAMSFWRRCR